METDETEHLISNYLESSQQKQLQKKTRKEQRKELTMLLKTEESFLQATSEQFQRIDKSATQSRQRNAKRTSHKIVGMIESFPTHQGGALSVEKVFTPLPRKSNKLVGRTEELTQLKQSFLHNRVLVLSHELGGVGKTLLAQQFVSDHEQEYQYVGWLNYANSLQETLFTALQPHFAEEREPTEIYPKILLALEELPSPKLLIVDDLADAQEAKQLQEHLKTWTILMISRQPLPYPTQEIRDLSFEDASVLFRKYCSKNIPDSILKKLFRFLRFHPLLIEIAAKTYELSLEWTADQFLEKLQNQAESNRAVKLNLPPVEETEQILYEHLGALFDLASIPPASIPILQGFFILGSQKVQNSELMEWFQILPSTEKSFSNLLQKLLKIGWITKSIRGFQCPRVIQEFISRHHPLSMQNSHPIIAFLTRTMRIKNWRDGSLAIVNSLPYAISMFRYRKIEEKGTVTLLFYVTAVLLVLDRSQEAFVFAKQAVEIAKKSFADQSAKFGVFYSLFALVSLKRNHSHKALFFAKQSVGIAENNFSDQPVKLAMFYSIQAMVFLEFEHSNLALESVKQVLEMVQESPEDQDLEKIYGTIARIYQRLQYFDEALEYAQKAIAITEQHPDEQSNLPIYYGMIAKTYKNLGRFNESLEFAKKAVDLNQNESEPSKLISLHDKMAMMYLLLESLDEVLFEEEKEVETPKNSFPEEHSNVVVLNERMAKIYEDFDHLEKALGCAQKAVDLGKTSLPANHPFLESAKQTLLRIEQKIQTSS